NERNLKGPWLRCLLFRRFRSFRCSIPPPRSPPRSSTAASADRGAELGTNRGDAKVAERIAALGDGSERTEIPPWTGNRILTYPPMLEIPHSPRLPPRPPRLRGSFQTPAEPPKTAPPTRGLKLCFAFASASAIPFPGACEISSQVRLRQEADPPDPD